MKSKKVKREEAQNRQDGYDELTIEQKIARLDFKFGKNVGATKERAKLQRKLDKQNEVQKQ
jgi:hypothetical protein